ncbi:unnamed protein product, partial [Didymodactylos carnosus]
MFESEGTQRFAQGALCVTVLQDYGLTETCAAGTIADQYDISVDRAGHPLVSRELWLINWEEGQYRNTDKPNLRGEILIGGKMVAQGYLGEASKENVNFKEIDDVRYFATGHIGEIFPNGTVRIADRKKDLIKLRRDEYVSLAKVENVIAKISSYTEKNFDTKEWEKLVDDQEFCDHVSKDVQDALTDALKLKRKAIEEEYKHEIENLYKDQPSNKQQSKKKSNSAGTKDDGNAEKQSNEIKMPVSERNKSKTAFVTDEDPHEFNRLPPGMLHLSPTFQRIMYASLKHQIRKFVLTYLHYIILYSKTTEDHIKHLEEIQQILEDKNLKLH